MTQDPFQAKVQEFRQKFSLGIDRWMGIVRIYGLENAVDSLLIYSNSPKTKTQKEKLCSKKNGVYIKMPFLLESRQSQSYNLK